MSKTAAGRKPVHNGHSPKEDSKMTMFLNHKQVANLIKTVGKTRTILVEGEAGSGKTSLLWEMRNDPAFSHYHIADAVDCTQLSDGSVWMPDIDRENGVSRELPNERFGVQRDNQKGMNGAKPVIICLDEIAKARQFIKDVLAPIVYERRVGNYHMPEGSIVFGCTNLSSEGLGDSMQAHLRNRIVIVKMRKPTKDEWVQDFAVPKGLSPEIIAAAEMYPQVFESFVDYSAGGQFAGKSLAKENPYIFDPQNGSQEQVVTPRSLHAASDVLMEMGALDDVTLQAALEGVIGAPFAAQVVSLIRFGRELPTFQRVCDEPDDCPVPKNPTAQLVQVFQFVTQVKDRDQAEAVSVYTKRMRNEMQSLFVHTVANSSRIDKFVMSKTFSALLAHNRQFFNA